MQSNIWNEDDLVDTSIDFTFDADDRITGIVRTQEIPENFLDEIAAIRDIQDNNALGNFALAARIPTVVVDHWISQGFNIFDKNITVADIVSRLQSLDMDRLIATNKKRLH